MRDIDDFGEALTTRGTHIIALANQMQREAGELPPNWEDVRAEWQRTLGIDPPRTQRMLYPWTDATAEHIVAFATAYLTALDTFAGDDYQRIITPRMVWRCAPWRMERAIERIIQNRKRADRRRSRSPQEEAAITERLMEQGARDYERMEAAECRHEAWLEWWAENDRMNDRMAEDGYVDGIERRRAIAARDAWAA